MTRTPEPRDWYPATRGHGDTEVTSERPGWSELPLILRATLVLAVAAAVGAGIAERIWYLEHDPLDSDEAVAGLMARHFLAGHANAFFWGQRYGGAETFVVMAAFWLFGSSTLVLRMVPVCLDVVACVLAWRVGAHLVRQRWLAVAAAAGMWAVPQVAVWNSTLEYGFRGVTMICGLALLLFTLRAVRRARISADVVGIGTAAGLGWWSSPEIVYFAVPSAIWFFSWAWSVRHELRSQARAAWLWAALLAGAASALPWLWDNVASGFPSLDVSTYYVPPTAPHYCGRLLIFVLDSWPLLLDLRVPSSGSLRVPTELAVAVSALVGVALVIASVWCLSRGKQAAGLAVAVLAYPFLVSMVPGSWLWQSGRYTVYFVPLALLLVIAAADAFVNRPIVRDTRRHARFVHASAAILLLLSLASTSAELSRFERVLAPAGVDFGSGPNAPALSLVRTLVARGLREGYADYWVAYKLDFLSGGRLHFVPAPPSHIRTVGMLRQAEHAPARRQVWLFVHPTALERAEYVDSTVIQGPGALAEQAFLEDLDRLGVNYHVVHMGAVDAIVPVRRVTFADVGLHPLDHSRR